MNMALKQIKENGFSQALFAPGFVWERHEGNQQILDEDINDKIVY